MYSHYKKILHLLFFPAGKETDFAILEISHALEYDSCIIYESKNLLIGDGFQQKKWDWCQEKHGVLGGVTTML